VAEKITSIAEDAQIRLVTQGNVFDQTAGASAHHHFYPAMEDGQFDVFAQELMQLVADILNPFVQTQLHNQYDMYHRSAKLVKYVLHDKANARLVPARKEDANLYGFLKSARFDDMTEYFRFYPDQLSLEPTAINANELIKDPHGSQKFKFNTFLDLIIHMGYEQNNYNRGENNKFGKFIVSHYKKGLISDPAQIESIKSRKDKTTAIVIGTNEISPSIAGQLFNLQSSFVYCALKEEEFATNEKEIINELKADFEIEKKSNGQRLRNVFYKLYEQDNEGFLTFVKYYDHKMEQLINHFKSKLDI
jgi:hypothetical protein